MRYGLQLASFPRFWGGQFPNNTVGVAGPAVPCEQVWLQNHPDSTGNIILGGKNLPALGEGVVLIPGATTGWIPVKNLNLIWHKFMKKFFCGLI